MARLVRIAIYPIKSLDPRVVETARVLPSGALEHDRRFAFVDVAGRFINGKRTDKVHTVESDCDPAARTVLLGTRGTAERRRFHLDEDRSALEDWLSEHFGVKVTLVENEDTGLPDDADAPGPTVLSTATLKTVASWFDGMSLDEARLRFRANLEIGGVEPFWEERLYTADGQVVRFEIGSVTLEGTNPCARCIVPMRSSTTGALNSEFKKTFMDRRPATLPAWAERSRFDHFYRLAVNTRPAPGFSGGTLHVGDEVRIVGAQPV